MVASSSRTGWRASGHPCSPHPLPVVSTHRHSRRLHCSPPQPAAAATTTTDAGHVSAAAAPNGAAKPAADAQPTDGGYRTPPEEILAIVDAPPQPGLSFSPDRTLILQSTRPPPLPPLHEMARPELKLAGVRIDAEQFSRSRMGYVTGLALVAASEVVPAPEALTRPITGYPPGSWLNMASWSPEGTHIAFTVRSPGAPADPPRRPLELWVAEVATGRARCLVPAHERGGLNTVFDAFTWVDDSTVVACCLPEGLPSPPSRPPVPPGPKIQDNSGGARVQHRTFTDLLSDEADSALFEYYGTCELVRVDVVTGARTSLGPPRLYTEVDASPDGRYLLVSWLERPFSYSVPCGRFPARVQVWDAATGALVYEVAALPLAEQLPIAFNAVRPGRRSISWRDDAPAELCWIEAQDGGDPDVAASPRDIVYTLPADAVAAAAAAAGSAAAPPPQPTRLAATDLRCGGVAWCDGDLALVASSWWKTRRSVWEMVAPDRREEPQRVLFDRNSEDVYSDPGAPLYRRTRSGTSILAKVAGARQLLFSGTGATPEGNRPFLDLLDLDTRESVRLWRSAAPYLENIGSIMNDGDFDAPIALDGLQLLLTREAVDAPPQTYIKTFSFQPGSPSTSTSTSPTPGDAGPDANGGSSSNGTGATAAVADAAAGAAAASSSGNGTRNGSGPPPEQWLPGVSSSERRLTCFPHPHPQLSGAGKEVLRYARADGVALTGTLHTPPGWQAGRDPPLPTLLWAYPREYKSKEAAGQMRRSPYAFSSVGSQSPLLWLTRGYAVLAEGSRPLQDGPSLPIVAEGEEEPNDTYVEQLQAGAAAAVAALVERGVADPARVSVGGHSYGAFMTANLLAHCPDLFAAGIARSGAYNRTLTPFGFQSEERTLWQAPDIYIKMSPFMLADKMVKPLLLIHGEDDNNTGTFPLQSERFYSALKGAGAPARLVLLPHEGHGYRARESVLHVLYEQDQWLERWAGHGRTDQAGYPGGSDSESGGASDGSVTE